MSSTAKTATSAIACPPGTLAGGPIRTRFFDGMFLTQADLETEQRYWRLKRRLTNRALGDGVVWGLRLDWKPQKHTFTLSPGYALDCCGNDLVVECPLELSEQQLWSRADPSLRPSQVITKNPDGAYGESGAVLNHGTAEQRDSIEACVVLQYVECPEEARPVHRDACAGPTGYCEPSRVRESVRLLLVPPPARPPKTPPELFLEELERWRDSLDPAIRDLIFPPPGTPPATTPSGQTPISIQVAIPGTTAGSATVQLPATGSLSVPTFHGIQTVSADRPTGVVQFRLHPSTGWAFTDGKVTDQGRTVEAVTPPAAPSMYWALDVALPEGAASARVAFEFVIDDVEVGETFGGGRRGRVTAHVTGTAVAERTGASVTVTVEDLTITVDSATVYEDVEGQACLRELVPWGWTVDPANGSKLGRTLVLASLYAFLSEVTRRGGSQTWRTIAQLVYYLAWFLLFGVNAAAPVDEATRRKLAELVLDLYRRWCVGFAYPGPRCSDEHHGVYLGCVELSRSGAIRRFDMWQHRRHVVTGPVLAHWGQQLGIAPIDVIAGRFASAMCCLAGLPPITLPGFEGGLQVKGGGITDSFHVGTFESVEAFGKERGASVTWMEPSLLSLRMTEVFTMKGLEGRPVDVLATRLPDGGSLAIAVPRAGRTPPYPKLREEVRYNLRHTPVYVREAGRDAVADFTVGILHAAPPTALLNNPDSADTHELAEALAKTRTTSADVAEDGAATVLVRSGLPDTKANREAAANLVEHAEKALDGTVKHVVGALGAKLDRSAFAIEANQKVLVDAIHKLFPKLPGDAVVRVAERTAKG